jgi:hypothetical protein
MNMLNNNEGQVVPDVEIMKDDSALINFLFINVSALPLRLLGQPSNHIFHFKYSRTSLRTPVGLRNAVLY